MHPSTIIKYTAKSYSEITQIEPQIILQQLDGQISVTQIVKIMPGGGGGGGYFPISAI